jgi:hypothetical protein
MNPALPLCVIIKITILSLFGLLSSSCTDQPKEQDLNSIDTKIISGRPEPTKLSLIAESIELVRLETRPDVLVGNATVKIVDSLAVVYSPQSGVFVFDSRTGEFKHKILGFRDRGPQGYSGSNVPLTLNEDGRIILYKWDRLGVWNYRTGAMLDHTLPLNPYKYSPLFFMNDSLLVGNVMNIYPDSKSTLDLISYHDGGIVREYGFMEKTDLNPHSTSMMRVAS